jgi:WD40 repeat protein
MAAIWGDGTAWLWDVATRRPITPPMLHREHVVAVAYHPGGKLVATASTDGTARLWDCATRKPIGPAMTLQKNNALRAVAFAPDGKSLAVGSQAGGVLLWHVPTPLDGTPSEIVRSIKLLTGMELDENGLFQMLDARRWNELRAR